MARHAVSCLLAATLLAAAAAADGLGGRDVPLDGLPPELEGVRPLERPVYHGVAQLLVLSDRWVIVVTHDLDRLFQEIDRRSGGELQRMVARWRASEQAGRPDWTAYRGRWSVRDQHIAAAREAIGERRLSEPGYYTIRSDDDPRYAQPQPPTRADRLLVSAGLDRTYGVFEVDWHNDNYLELPRPMRDGCRYTIALADGRAVTFRFDRLATVSRAIKVNQVGYLPDAGRKVAYLGAWLGRFGPLPLPGVEQFEVIDAATGDVAYRGTVTLAEADPRFAPAKDGDDPAAQPRMYGEDVYELDFTPLTATGVFFISVPGVGRSWPFRHAPDAYGEAFYTAARGLYHQRAGIAIEDAYSAWTRPAARNTTVYESQLVFLPPHLVERPKGYEVFDIIGGSIDRSVRHDDVVGGWHDAADWDRNLYHYACVFDLLNAYEAAPERFTDGQLNLPESGNGVPDILDEAEFGLRVWLTSMDARGGVSGMVETWTHPRIDDPNVAYTFSVRTRWSSLIFAAAAAQYAQLAAPHDPVRATTYRTAALRAYAFGHDPANSLGRYEMHAKKNRGQGEPYTVTYQEQESDLWPYLLHARCRLYLLTGEAAWLDGVDDLASKAHRPMQWRFSAKDWSVWIYDSLVKCRAGLPASLVTEWERYFIAEADRLAALQAESPYRCAWPRKLDNRLAWGASTMFNYNRVLSIAWRLTGAARYRDAMLANADFMLGANPMGMSWTTGLGMVYPIDFQHANSENDGLWDPVPGITVYGITGGPIFHRFRETVWQSPSPDGPVQFASPEQQDVPLWRRWMVHPHVNTAQCEFTVWETMAATIYTMAQQLPGEWRPSEALRQRRPRRDDELYGRWYLP